MKKFGKILLVGGLLGAVLLGGCGSKDSKEEKEILSYMQKTGLNRTCAEIFKDSYLWSKDKSLGERAQKLHKTPMDKPLGGIEPVFMPKWVRDGKHYIGKDVEYTFHNGNVYVPRVFIDYPQDGYRVIYDVELYDDKYKVWRVRVGFRQGVNAEFEKKARAILEAEKGKDFSYSHNQYIRMVAEDIGVIERKDEKNV